MITTGSYRKRKRTDGSHYWQITIELPKDPITGKRVRKYKSVDGTKKDAERAMHEFIREIEKGYYVTDSKITISEWIDTWLEVYIIPNVSPTTLARYQSMIKLYIKPIIGHMQVQQLNTLAVQNWVNSLKISPASGKPMAAATVKHAYHVLKGSMDKAVLAGIISRTPCISIMLPKGQKKAAIIYDEAQIKQLICAAKGTEMELVIDMKLCLGLRRGELLGLWWQDIDWDKKQIHIVRNRVVVNGKSVVKEPKTANSILRILNRIKSPEACYQFHTAFQFPSSPQHVGMNRVGSFTREVFFLGKEEHYDYCRKSIEKRLENNERLKNVKMQAKLRQTETEELMQLKGLVFNEDREAFMAFLEEEKKQTIKMLLKHTGIVINMD